MPTIAVLDYGIGNLRSAQKALERAGADAILTAEAKVVKKADGVVLPGVGNFGTCIEALRTTGVDQMALDAIESRRPFLGICIGMQLLFERSEESPNCQGLGVLSGEVRSLPENVRRPQMQWNAIHVRKNSQILKGLDGKWLYFVHSYAADLSPNNDMVAATCTYGNDVVAAVQSENVFATQFHPEKSSDAGKEFLVNFVNSCRGI
ncbi:MAG: imidazole glycerol phosphate synthase subunit HisH [Acidimicrobiaceae bacterium]|nr:imidazole glycerol phosphate synthase subunit HisH [Acidimicrobiaceae bacterium]